MTDFFKFPEQYKVSKHMGKNVFIDNANLTASEKKRLSAYMKQIEVLYDISFADNSEVIVLYSDISKSNYRQEYFVSNYVKAIKQSIPYLCLLIIYCEGVFKLFLFDEHVNIKDENRKVVDKIFSTRSFVALQDRSSIDELNNELNDAVLESFSADVLYDKWKEIIEDGCNNISDVDFDFLFCIDRAQIFIERARKYQSSLENRNVKKRLRKTRIRDVESDVYEGVALDPRHEAIDFLYIDFCKAKCRKLFDEANINGRIDEATWLDYYIAACEEYAEEILRKSIDTECIGYIVEAFEKTDNDFEDGFDGFDENYLREICERYYI